MEVDPQKMWNSNLAIGQKIRFSDGKEFEYHGILNRGHSDGSLIIDVGNEKVIRIPSPIRGVKWGIKKNLEYEKGYKKLKDLDIPLVKTYLEESNGPEYLVQDKLNLSFTLKQLEYYNLKVNLESSFLDKEQENRAILELPKFIEKFWQIDFISDFSTRQVGWDKEKGWVTFDFGDEVIVWSRNNLSKHIWESMDFLRKVEKLFGENEDFRLIREELRSLPKVAIEVIAKKRNECLEGMEAF